MTRLGINAIRTYTVPPPWLLDQAERFGLLVMAGIPWEQHVAFLDDPALTRAICQRVRAGVRACAGHPAVLCCALGNEIPASIVRWHGARRVERFLRSLYFAAKEENPDGLCTYVNFPTTEYLQLPFLDLVCFNVYLRSHAKLTKYIARLHNLAGERPLLIAEVGLDSRREGEDVQAFELAQQVRAVMEAGCAGTFVFSWTDEWHRGSEIRDWDFGLTRRDGSAKPALLEVAKAFGPGASVPITAWPRISVVVCTHNGARHIQKCLAALEHLDHPNYEVIVVDDGSTDNTAALARRSTIKLIQTENRGLSAARNTGLQAASGEVVAYLDDDAYPDRDWLKHVTLALLNSDYAGVGGPNIPPDGTSRVAECVAHAPGGPAHVLLSDTEAEHIPGCNMAFWRKALLEVGGFDPQFRTAGDDVDLCWRLQAQGWTLGFSPSAVIFHHRRESLRAYWKQQVGYGKAEALLERKWPEKYNAAGHLSWAGRIYNGRGLTPTWWQRGRLYQGIWGTAAYQRLDQPAKILFAELALLPEWYLIILSLVVLSLIGMLWKPLLWTVPALGLASALPLAHAAWSAASTSATIKVKHSGDRLRVLSISLGLHLMQPLARLCGRLSYGFHPWRRRGSPRILWTRARTISMWSEEWRSPDGWLRQLQSLLHAQGTVVLAGGSCDNWDLEIRGGMLARARVRMVTEEHGGGCQMLRFRIWPLYSVLACAASGGIGALAAAAALDKAWLAAAVLVGISMLIGRRILYESSIAIQEVTSGLVTAEKNLGVQLEIPASGAVVAAGQGGGD
jgi:GT2 family glycosyltransferase